MLSRQPSADVTSLIKDNMLSAKKSLALVRKRVAKSSRKSRLAKRLITIVFTLYFGVAITMTFFQLSIEYQHEKDGLKAEITRLFSLFEPMLASSIWNVDESSVDSALRSLMLYPGIKGIALNGDFEFRIGEVMEGDEDLDYGQGRGQNPEKIDSIYRKISYRFPVIHRDLDGRVHNGGVLIIYSSTEVLYQRIKVLFITTIGSAIVKTLFLWLVLYWVLNFVVGHPITRITRLINLITQRETGLLEGDKFLKRCHQEDCDELFFLMKSFVNMQNQLRRKRREIETYHQELEQKVMLRTQQLHYQASHDELTGLLNRGEFEKLATEMLMDERGGIVTYALAFIDLDRFKIVNDTLGHAAGDQLLREVTEILQNGVRKMDLVGRMGGDEFAIFLSDCEEGCAEKVIDSIRKKIESTSFVLEGRKFSVGMSAGIAIVSDENRTLASALRSADAACYIAKESGRNQVQFYRRSGDRRRYELRWINEIKDALQTDRFALYFQPVFSPDQVFSKVFNRFEVLLRMIDENGDILLPESFIPAAERYRLATKIDYWVVGNFFQFYQDNYPNLECVDTFYINLFGASLSDEKFAEFVVAHGKECGMPLERVCFEIAETAKIPNFSKALDVINQLRTENLRFSLDDFGSGVSSFDYLKEVPVDVVKVYGGFVQNIVSNPVDATIIESIISVSHAMGKEVVAEFVESPEIAKALTAMGVDYLQGAGLQKPQPITRLVERVNQTRAAP